jgi:hypothetical protein
MITTTFLKKIDSWKRRRSYRIETEPGGLTGPWWRSYRQGLARPPRKLSSTKISQGISTIKAFMDQEEEQWC